MTSGTPAAALPAMAAPGKDQQLFPTLRTS